MMDQKKINKNCCVRLPEELHRRAKLHAYASGISLQEWLIQLIESALSVDKSRDACKDDNCDIMSKYLSS